MTEQIQKKHRNIFAASIIVLSITVIFLVLGPVTRLYAVDKWSAAVKSLDGSPIAYGVGGRNQGSEAPALVFIHGWTCNHELWAAQLEYFSKGHKVIWLDLADHGESGSKRDDYTMQAFGRDVVAVVDKTGTDKAILIGHSMGGPVAVEAARLLGDKVAGIVAVDIFFTSLGLPDSKDGIVEFLRPFRSDFPSASETFVRSMFLPEADPERVTSIVEIMSGADKDMAVSALGNVTEWLIENGPSLPGEFAPKLRAINAVRAADPVGQAGVVTIPDVGHFIAQVKPDVFNKALERIISEY
uniref:Pimeloyl-ACP methyl ester carboxylesterase n=1 Tax=Candidatus Kentrum sp. FW TaxID=2126338 RepID=A0A450TFF2_9GAMM|nr:MAG: Pimeloyl-ACP methyl ester carboxylesterase [Candidatus Kentron sp. FW]